MNFNRQFKTPGTLNRRENMTATTVGLDQKKIVKTKNKSPKTIEHEQKRTLDEDKVILILQYLVNYELKAVSPNLSDRVVLEFHKYIGLFSATSSTASIIHFLFGKTYHYEGAYYTKSSTTYSSEAMRQAVEKLQIILKEKSIDVVYGDVLDPSISADFDSIVKQIIQLPHENIQKMFDRGLLTQFYFMRNLMKSSEAVEKGKKSYIYSPAINGKDGSSYHFTDLVGMDFGLDALPDQGPSATGSKEEPFAETDPAYEKTMLDVHDIVILTSDEFGEGAFHTVKEVVLTLLGGLRDSALHAVARIIDFKSSRNVIVHWFQKFVSLVVTQGRWSYYSFGMVAMMWHSRGKSAIQMTNNRIQLEGKRLFHSIHTQKINVRVDIF